MKYIYIAIILVILSLILLLKSKWIEGYSNCKLKNNEDNTLTLIKTYYHTFPEWNPIINDIPFNYNLTNKDIYKINNDLNVYFKEKRTLFLDPVLKTDNIYKNIETSFDNGKKINRKHIATEINIIQNLLHRNKKNNESLKDTLLSCVHSDILSDDSESKGTLHIYFFPLTINNPNIIRLSNNIIGIGLYNKCGKELKLDIKNLKDVVDECLCFDYSNENLERNCDTFSYNKSKLNQCKKIFEERNANLLRIKDENNQYAIFKKQYEEEKKLNTEQQEELEFMNQELSFSFI